MRHSSPEVVPATGFARLLHIVPDSGGGGFAPAHEAPASAFQHRYIPPFFQHCIVAQAFTHAQIHIAAFAEQLQAWLIVGKNQCLQCPDAVFLAFFRCCFQKHCTYTLMLIIIMNINTDFSHTIVYSAGKARCNSHPAGNDTVGGFCYQTGMRMMLGIPHCIFRSFLGKSGLMAHYTLFINGCYLRPVSLCHLPHIHRVVYHFSRHYMFTVFCRRFATSSGPSTGIIKCRSGPCI